LAGVFTIACCLAAQQINVIVYFSTDISYMFIIPVWLVSSFPSSVGGIYKYFCYKFQPGSRDILKVDQYESALNVPERDNILYPAASLATLHKSNSGTIPVGALYSETNVEMVSHF
jgi:hypothetical protein